MNFINLIGILALAIVAGANPSTVDDDAVDARKVTNVSVEVTKVECEQIASRLCPARNFKAPVVSGEVAMYSFEAADVKTTLKNDTSIINDWTLTETKQTVPKGTNLAVGLLVNASSTGPLSKKFPRTKTLTGFHEVHTLKTGASHVTMHSLCISCEIAYNVTKVE